MGKQAEVSVAEGLVARHDLDLPLLLHGLGAEFAEILAADLRAGAMRARASRTVSRSSFYTEIARLGEAGKLHGLFLAEQMTNKDTGTGPPPRSGGPASCGSSPSPGKHDSKKPRTMARRGRWRRRPHRRHLSFGLIR